MWSKVIRRIVVIVIVFSPLGAAVLPRYLPAEQQNNLQRDNLIEQYFHLGLQHWEILAFLLLQHGIRLGIRQLKRILSRRGLTRRNNTSDVQDILHAIETELKGSGGIIGYRAMHQRLVNHHNLVIDKETVRTILRIVDPVGVENRSKHRLKRRQYRSKGPNYIWHMDGYDKLKPFGFCIHGCIDGYSQRIVWLEVGVTNNDPDVTAGYFLDAIRSVGGVPRILRADNGTENVHIAAFQRFFRREAVDAFAGEKSFIYGRSFSNQRIEAWWGQLRRGGMDWWITFFKDLRDNGLFCDDNIFHVESIRLCFMFIIQEELNKAAKLWNLHRIRPSTNPESPPRRPDMLYFLPEISNTQDYKTVVTVDDVELVEETCGLQNVQLPCSPEFISLAEIIMRENGLMMPSNANDTKALYIELLDKIKEVEDNL